MEKKWILTEEEYRTRQNYGPDYLDTLRQEEITAYLACYQAYARMLHTYFIRHFNLKEYDEALEESPYQFPPVKEEEMDLYQYLARDQLSFVYIRNNLYPERLECHQLEYLRQKAGEEPLCYDAEADAFIADTWKQVILEDASSDLQILRGPNNSGFFAPIKGVTIGIRWDDYYQIPGQSDEQWLEMRNGRLQDMETLCIILEVRMPKLSGVDMHALHYNVFSVKKRKNNPETEEII